MKYLLIILISTPLLACPPYAKLANGEPAPCNGGFFSEPAEKKLKDNYSVLEQTVDKQKKQLTFKDLAISAKSKEKDLWEAEAKKQAEDAKSFQNDLRNGALMGVGGSILLYLLINSVKK